MSRRKKQKASVAKSTSLMQSRWNKFHKWEKEYEIKRYRELTPLEKIKIFEDMYLFVVKIKNSISVK